MLLKTEVRSMLKAPLVKSISVEVTNEYLKKIREEVGPSEILAICNKSSITQSKYSTVYKKFKSNIRDVGLGLEIACLPKPFHVSILRINLNTKLNDYASLYYHINETLEILTKKGTKKKILSM